MTLVAEGIKTEAQLAFLRHHGCETFQGWLFAKAMPAAEVTVHLMTSRAMRGLAQSASIRTLPQRSQRRELPRADLGTAAAQ